MHSFARRLSLAPLLALLLAPRTSLAAPAFGPEQAVAAPEATTSLFGQTAPSVATNGTDFLFSWSNQGKIVCARVSAGQVLLDKTATPLALQGKAPQTLWDGQKYVVVSDGQAQRVDPTTGVPDVAVTLAGAGTTGQAAVGGGNVFDVWQAADGSLQGALFGASGAQVGAGVTLPSGPVSDWGVAASSGQFLVAWVASDGTVAAARVTLGGTVLDSVPVVIAGGTDASAPPAAKNLNAAASPDVYLVSWDSGTYPYDHILSARVGTTGPTADPGGLLVSSYFQAGTTTAAWDGAEWWITVNQPYSAVGTLLGTTGAPSASALYQGANALSAAANPGARVIAGDFDLSVQATFISTSGTGDILANDAGTLGIGVSEFPADQLPQCAAASSAGYLLVWSENGAVFGNRFGFDGTTFDATPFSLGMGSTAACGAIGDRYYVAAGSVTNGGYGADVRSIATSGPLSTNDNVVSLDSEAGTEAYAAPAAMACMTDRCLLLWKEYNNTFQAVLFGAGGTVIAPPFNATYGGQWGLGYTGLAANGTSFLVAQWPADSETGGLLAIAADGSHGAFVPTTYASPAVAGGGGEFVIASNTNFERVDPAGTPLGSFEPLPLNASGPSVVWEGSDFFLAQGGSFVSTPAGSTTPIATEIPVAPYDAEAGAAPLPTQPLFSDVGTVLAASDGAGHVMAVISRPHGPFATSTLYARFGSPAPDVPDAGPGDAAPDDAGGPVSTPDGAPPVDAGPPANDASPVDATTPIATDDGGTSALDATTGAMDDGGTSASNASSSGGCGCTTAGADAQRPSGWLAIAPLALLFAKRRRARRAAATHR